jgi:RNA polymerase sigma-70 factor (ECF subfamily)
VDAVLAGNSDAYRLLVDREARAVVGLCTSIIGNPDEAQDVAQEAFVQAYRSLAGYRGDGSFGAWIGRIATRMAVAHKQSLKRNVAAPVDVFQLTTVDVAGNPERELLRFEHSRDMRAAIAALPVDQREVVRLRFFKDMSLEQIAAETSTPIGTVKSRLHRALARLRERRDLRSVS